MNGDTLARGGKSAKFGPAQGISQTTWDAIWADEPKEFNPNRSSKVKESEQQIGEQS